MTTVGVLHPGAMGVSVAAACTADVVWCADGRSPETAQRADRAGLTAVATLDDLVERSDVIVSVCPPGSAVDVADSIQDKIEPNVFFQFIGFFLFAVGQLVHIKADLV